METYAWDAWQILAIWFPWVYEVMIRLYEFELEFGLVIYKIILNLNMVTHVINWQSEAIELDVCQLKNLRQLNEAYVTMLFCFLL
jgi:hypothetical protein